MTDGATWTDGVTWNGRTLEWSGNYPQRRASVGGGWQLSVRISISQSGMIERECDCYTARLTHRFANVEIGSPYKSTPTEAVEYLESLVYMLGALR